MLAILGIPIIPTLLVIVCLVVFIAAFVAPRRSQKLQSWIHSALGKGRAEAVDKSPLDDDEKAAKPFDTGQKVVDKTADTARTARGKSPF